MKLTKIEIRRETGQVHCECSLRVQTENVTIPFVVREADLHVAAAARNKETWDDEDVATVGSQIVGSTITL